jgi:hypothetical protein
MYNSDMGKKRLTHDQKIVKALEKVKTPILDEHRNLSIYFKERSRSNETGIEHVAKNYHGLDPSDIELLVDSIKKPMVHVKDRRYPRTYCYYHARKSDKNHYIKVVVKVENNLKTGYISSIFITSRIKKG